MKQLKYSICLLLLVAFVTGCETESIQSVEDTSSDLRLTSDVTATKKAALAKELIENRLSSRVAINYEGELCPGEVASGETPEGSIFDLITGGHWYFSAEAGDVMSFDVDRVSCNSDPISALYFGFGDSDNFIYIGEADDDVPPSCEPDCFAFGDPYVVDFVMPFTGVYTIVVWDWGTECSNGVPLTYNITLTGQNTCVINIDGCDTGVSNQFVGDSNMDEMIDALEAGDYKNHGQFVRAVAHLTNEWHDAGLITKEEKDAIMSCAAQSNIPY